MNKRSVATLTALAGVAAGAGAYKFRHRNADWLRNDEGVGPTHVPGTNRGEEHVQKSGIETPGTAAGRRIGGIDPS